MANRLLTIDMITREILRIFENNSIVTRNCNRQYDDQFADEGAKIGDTVRIRLPDRVLVSEGAVFQGRGINEQNTTLTLSTQLHTDFSLTSAEMTMSLQDYSDTVLVPRISQLAATVDSTVCNGVAKQIGQSVGTPGTTPSTVQVLLAGQQKLNEQSVPLANRFAVVNPAANAALVGGFTNLFNPSGAISEQYKTGNMANNTLGYQEIGMSQSIGQFTTGSRSAGATVTTTVAAQGQTTLAVTTNGATDTIKQGDVFTVAGVFAVNPQTRQTTGSLYQFVVGVDAVAAGSAVTLTVPAMYTADQALATIDTFPQAGAAVTWLGGVSTAYPQNLIYYKDSIALATADLVMPKGVDMAGRANHNGLSMRVVRQYDAKQDQMIGRIDILFGFKVLRPEGCVRLWG